jgi:monomeric isocitrate dehydrogenase
MPTRATERARQSTKSAPAKRTSKSTSAKKSTAKKSTGKKGSGVKRASTGQSTRRSSSTTRGAARRNPHGKRKWSAGVDTESTHPQEGLFKKDAATIARRLASKQVSPKGPSSGMRMLTFYVNRAGKNLTESRLRVLERAKALLHERIEKSR